MAVFFDFATGKIPNRLIAGGVAASVAYTLFAMGPPGMIKLLLGMIIPLLTLGLLFKLHAMGGGDIKLFMFLGSAFGTDILKVIFCSFIFGAGQALIRLILNNQFFIDKKIVKEKSNKIHFALAIFFSTLFLSLSGILGV
ncbi:MAG: prepilin peptidase [Lachnospiraceae bacterium]|nr:prepilin peptidase [Lachnospiraceae bacterium]